MKKAIFYFSGTGNSLYVARKISFALSPCVIVPAEKYNSEEIYADILGFVFPVYAWGLPKIFINLLQQIKIKGNPYIFAVATCGSYEGDVFKIVKIILIRKNLKLNGTFVLKMPGNYFPLYGAKSSQKQEKQLKKVDGKINEIKNAVLKRKKLPEKESNPLSFFLTKVVYRFALSFFKKLDRLFYTNSFCNSCGICVKVCPVRNIKLVNGRPKWLGKCQQCMRCICWCPVKAINVRFIPQKRRRYRHPEFNCEDFYA